MSTIELSWFVDQSSGSMISSQQRCISRRPVARLEGDVYSSSLLTVITLRVALRHGTTVLLRQCVTGTPIIADMNEQPFYTRYGKRRRKIYELVNNQYFDIAISMVIFLNVISMAVEHYQMSKVGSCSCYLHCSYLCRFVNPTTIHLLTSISFTR